VPVGDLTASVQPGPSSVAPAIGGESGLGNSTATINIATC